MLVHCMQGDSKYNIIFVKLNILKNFPYSPGNMASVNMNNYDEQW